jgi:hypothetical protein
MTPGRRLAGTAAMFAITLVFLVIAGATHEVWPLFVGWIPLLLVPWLLTRPGSDDADVGTGGSPADGDDVEVAATPASADVPSDAGPPGPP